LAATTRKGSISVPLVSGRPPASPDEIALGPALLDELGKGIGDQVDVDVDGAPRPHTVVGTMLSTSSVADRYAQTAFLTPEGLERAGRIESGFRQASVRYRDGVDVDAAAARLGEDLELDFPQRAPRAIVDLQQIRRLPLLLGLFLALLGVGAIAHAIVVAGLRRARDLAILRALGFTPRQAATTMVVMALTIVVVGLGLGIPLGLFVANLTWQAIADAVYVATDLNWPTTVIAAAIPAALVVAVVVALLPAWRAARLRPDRVLRAE
jgi:putative ABC transport system permease protein